MGNLLTDVSGGGTTTYSYDYRDRLTSVKVGGTVVATYVYDAMDRRIGFKESGTQTWVVWDGQNPYADFDGSGTLLTRYLYGPEIDQLLARTSSGGTTGWYLEDKLGTVRDIANSSGSQIDHLAYDSCGTVLSESNSANGDRFKSDGMAWDAAIDLYYDNARYYDPATGRFISQDPTGFGAGDANVYRYVHNGPTDGVDPTGLQVDFGAGLTFTRSYGGRRPGTTTLGFGPFFNYDPVGSVSPIWSIRPGGGRRPVFVDPGISPASPDPSFPFPYPVAPTPIGPDPYTGVWPPYYGPGYPPRRVPFWRRPFRPIRGY